MCGGGSQQPIVTCYIFCAPSIIERRLLALQSRSRTWSFDIHWRESALFAVSRVSELPRAAQMIRRGLIWLFFIFKATEKRASEKCWIPAPQILHTGTGFSWTESHGLEIKKAHFVDLYAKLRPWGSNSRPNTDTWLSSWTWADVLQNATPNN